MRPTVVVLSIFPFLFSTEITLGNSGCGLWCELQCECSVDFLQTRYPSWVPTTNTLTFQLRYWSLLREAPPLPGECTWSDHGAHYRVGFFFPFHLGVLLHVLATYESQRTLCKLRRAGDKSPGSCVWRSIERHKKYGLSFSLTSAQFQYHALQVSSSQNV